MKKLFGVIVFALALSIAVCPSVMAETFELKISTTQTETSMIYAGLQAAANEIMGFTPHHSLAARKT